MLWERTVGTRAAAATRAEAVERSIMGGGTVCPRLKEEGEAVLRPVELMSSWCRRCPPFLNF